MSIFSDQKEEPIPYIPWETRRAERVARENHSEVIRIKESKSWFEANMKRVDRWASQIMSPVTNIHADKCMFLLIRILEKEGEQK